MDYMEKYKMWVEDPYFDEQTKLELKNLTDEKEIEDRFFKDLEFGTAGLRGKIGAGTNRMNVYTVSLATQGLASTILKRGEEAKKRGVAIAYDVRMYSDKFAEIAARVLAANGIKVYLFDGIRPTPMLSYTIRKLGTISGIVITASHNPKDYNGYKVYWEEGSQILDEIADEILSEISKIGHYKNVKMMNFDEAKDKGLIEILGKEIDDQYTREILNMAINDENVDKDIKIVYTPLNGTGNKPVRRVLKERGFNNIIVVPEQENPDPTFATVGYPNPEDTKAFKYARELGLREKADLLLATDPDSDRVAVAVMNDNGDYTYLNGNQTGALLVNYIVTQRHAKNDLSSNAAIVKSIVTGDLGKAVAKKYGVTTFETLTGFKNICAKANEWDITGEYKFLFGYEESIGYVYQDLVRDKDAIVSSMIIAEMAGYYKNKGMSLLDVLENMYSEYGYYAEKQISIVLEGIEGQYRIKRMMDDIRHQPIMSIGEMMLKDTIDYLRDETDAGKSNVLRFFLDDGSWYAIRPSGTEPKIKIYIYTVADTKENANEKIELIEKVVLHRIESVN
ncbi:phospho-sugar mutase [Soehngenia longivitae]|uniref:Phosphoglucomutase n=1 Tax=Soehngenia longivitae TaxID=2562294 RepID=A0A4Z0D527_9FIRM|nr:phospho-sugar mutase [Soehngenia longivitae]TFZ40226.1 phospho-sugar mutase [Soehngenia longivitae]